MSQFLQQVGKIPNLITGRAIYLGYISRVLLVITEIAMWFTCESSHISWWKQWNRRSPLRPQTHHSVLSSNKPNIALGWIFWYFAVFHGHTVIKWHTQASSTIKTCRRIVFKAKLIQMNQALTTSVSAENCIVISNFVFGKGFEINFIRGFSSFRLWECFLGK